MINVLINLMRGILSHCIRIAIITLSTLNILQLYLSVVSK